MEKTKEIIHLKSHIQTGCQYCNNFKFIHDEDSYLENSINHYIQEHNFKLLYVGQETTRDDNSNPWQSTIAIIGADKVIKKKVPPKIEIKFIK